MTAILTAAEMRALEQEAIASGTVTGLELMERAGRGVVEAMLRKWPHAGESPQRALVLCGPGNNGGDGFVVARLLGERGWDVQAWHHGDPARLPSDSARAYEAWSALGRVRRLTVPVEGETYDALHGWTDRDRSQPLYVIDALFGIGLTRSIVTPSEIDDLAMFLVSVDDLWLDRGGPDVRAVAVDIPSGVCADSGRILLPDDPDEDHEEGVRDDPRFYAFQADLTVTFQQPKPGHFLADGPRMVGELVVADIGLKRGRSRVHPVEAPQTGFLIKHAGHKYTHGHALLLAGGPGRGGAARLAARGALRIGAGLVTLAVPPAALQENAARLDAIMLRSVRDAEALADLLADPRLNALAAGPGLGTSDREAALLHALLDASGGGGKRADAPPRPVVLDADALTLIARHPDLRAKLHDRCVLTPHDGEFARLFPAIAERLAASATTGPAYSKVDATRDAAKEAGCVLLLKGPDTVIADPTGRAAISAAVYDRAAPWLATAGSGDVLTGFIAGLLARGFAPFDDACTAAWLHIECARSFGPGLIAEDLPEELPKVFRSLGL